MGHDDEPVETVTERNEYRDTLVQSRSTVQGCGDAVHGGPGSPLDRIASPLASGGWVCSEADAWTAEMADRCAGITEAFDDAAQQIGQQISSEPTRVPEDDWRGKQWPRTWVHRRNY